jgi:hypothetical protein
MPFLAVRARFMGRIAPPLDRSPLQAIQELWGGELPPFDAREDMNCLLDALTTGLWNRLTAHQTDSNPFKLAVIHRKQDCWSCCRNEHLRNAIRPACRFAEGRQVSGKAVSQPFSETIHN